MESLAKSMDWPDHWACPGEISVNQTVPRKRPVLSNQSVRIMSAQLRELGLRPEPVLAECGIEPGTLGDPKGQVTPEQEFALQKRFAELTRRHAGVWLRTGLQYHPLNMGALGLAMISAPTMRRGMELGIEYQDLTFSQCLYRLHYGDGGDVDGIEIQTDSVEPDVLEFNLHRSLGALRTVFNDMWQGVFPFARIETTLPRPAPDVDFAAILAAPVTFSAPRNVMFFKGDALEKPLPLGNPLLEDTYDRQCREILERHATKDEIADNVAELLVRCTGEWPSAREVAGKLAMTERTLQRRLAQAHVQFRDLLDRVREQRARDLLRDTRMSVEQITECLGYAEAASFTRAFTRWTGQAPTVFRRQAA